MSTERRVHLFGFSWLLALLAPADGFRWFWQIGNYFRYGSHRSITQAHKSLTDTGERVQVETRSENGAYYLDTFPCIGSMMGGLIDRKKWQGPLFLPFSFTGIVNLSRVGNK
jgi:hypothetical protein